MAESEKEKICKNKIYIIQEGYSFTDSEQRMRATGSITLIKSKKHVILVDTGSPRDKDKLLESLANLEIDLHDIDYVICTHGHLDHIGNLNLFPEAVHIVGNDICYRDDIYMKHSLQNGEPYVLVQGEIEIIPTVGHTFEDISVVVYNTQHGTVAIVGDLFECKNDEEMWRDLSQCIDKQELNRARVKQKVDIIIPGHGAMFETKT